LFQLPDARNQAGLLSLRGGDKLSLGKPGFSGGIRLALKMGR
jgi:hypothetical protein